MNVFVKMSLTAALLGLAVLNGQGAERGSGPGFSTLANPPLYFEAVESGRFAARGQDCMVLIAPDQAVLALGRPAGKTGVSFGNRNSESQVMETWRVRLQLEGANAAATMTGLDRISGRANYFVGNDPSAWRTGIPLFARVAVDEIYPGIRMIYYADQAARLEYDFVVQPNADPGRISFRVEGADKVRVDANGDLVLAIAGNEVRQQKPRIYQETGGARKYVEGGYRLTGRTTVAFQIAGYDRSLPLVIDPVLDFVNYIGGTKTEYGWGIAFQGGNVYVAGETLSKDLVTSAAAFTTFAGGSRTFGDAFVAKYDSSGANIYLTYFGGRWNDGALAIAADAGGNAFVTGFTDSTNFPLTPLGPTLAKTNLNDGAARNNNTFRIYPVDAFVAQFDPAGALVYSTYLGGSGRDEGVGIVVDPSGDLYVAGVTESNTNFPVTPGAFQSTNAGLTDAFVAKLNPSSGPPLIYCTYIGGTNADYAQGIAVNTGTGEAYITGFTSSTNFPVANTFSHTNVAIVGGATNVILFTFDNLNNQTNFSARTDAFISMLSASGGSLPFSMYLGGSNDDAGLHITLDASGTNAFVTGYTFSKDFPTNVVTTNPFDTDTVTNITGTNITQLQFTATNFSSHVFVTKVNASGLVYSTQFGGGGIDRGMGIALDNSDQAYVTGFSTSTNFAGVRVVYVDTNGVTVRSLFTNNPAFTDLRATTAAVKKGKGLNDAFIAVLSADGSSFVSTNSVLLGTLSGNDEANGIALDVSGPTAYIIGHTTSSNMAGLLVPPLFNGGKKARVNDAFVGKITY